MKTQDELNKEYHEKLYAAQMKKHNPGKNGIIAVAVITFVVFFVVWVGCSGNSDTSDGLVYSRKYTKLDAWVNAQQFVKNHLKSPASADFPSAYESSVIVESDTSFLIGSYVDAENSFGGNMRSNWSCRIVFEPDGMVSCKDFQLNQR